MDFIKSELGENLLERVMGWAEEAFTYAASARTRLMLCDLQDKSPGDFVTSVDISIEKTLCAHILAAFPDHSICAEESLGVTGLSDYCWYIDPIDGTMNYIRTGQNYCVAIALYRGNEPVLGVVWGYNGSYAAWRGEVVLFPDVVAVLPQAQALTEAIVCYSAKSIMRLAELGGGLTQLLVKTKNHRYAGVAALELCSVASGSSDIYFSTSLKPWDYAAARVILEARGCRFVQLDHPLPFVLAWRSDLLLRLILDDLPPSIRTQIIWHMEAKAND
ncbi:MAG: inositol monophosphatase family protein [Symbiobacteriaceae bacterium]|nr:inositol monophosphatase family protein [Symbiobacteriaceae bacterium]